MLSIVFLSPTVASAAPLEDVVHASEVALRAEVVGVRSCLSNDQKSAWKFWDLAPIEVLRGQLTWPGAPQPTFTVRVPAGDFPDGTTTTIVGLSRLDPGDDVVLFLQSDDGGASPYLPLVNLRDGLFRVEDLSGGGKAMVDAQGAPLTETSSREPGRRSPSDTLRAAYLYLDRPLSHAAATGYLNAQIGVPAWNGVGVPAGPWAGKVTIDAAADQWGLETRCVASLEGAVSSGHLSAAGSCTASAFGDTDVTLDADRVGNRWLGSLEVVGADQVARSLPIDLPASRTDAVAGVIDDQLLIGAQAWDVEATLGVVFVGERRLMLEGDFRARVLAAHAADPSGAGSLRSTPPNQQTCNFALVHQSL